MNGWIKLHKSITEHWLWDDPVVLKAWIDLLLSVNYMDKKTLFNGRLITVRKGQIITSIRKLAERWGCTRRKANNIITMFAEDGMVELKRDKDGTLLTVLNYGIYQDMRDTNNTTESTTQDTTESTTQSTQHKNIKNNKEYKKEREEEPLPEISVKRFPCGEYQNVFLSNEEAAKLQKEFPEEAADMIEKLSEYMETSGKKYANHYAVLCKWIREDRKTMAAGGKTSTSQREEDEINARQRKAIADCGYIGDEM